MVAPQLLHSCGPYQTTFRFLIKRPMFMPLKFFGSEIRSGPRCLSLILAIPKRYQNATDLQQVFYVVASSARPAKYSIMPSTGPVQRISPLSALAARLAMSRCRIRSRRSV